MMSFSQYMKKTRTAAGVTQRHLSAETGYSVAFIGAWEQGKAYPPYSVLGKLSKLLKIEKDSLLKEVVKWKKEEVESKYIRE